MPARFRLWDNGGRSADRYTVVDARGWRAELDGRIYRNGVAFSRSPYHPQGIGLSIELDDRNWAGANFRSWGRRIKFGDLEGDGRILVASFLLDCEATEAQARTLGTTLEDCRAWAKHHGTKRWQKGLPPSGVRA